MGGVALYTHTGDFVVWLCTYTRATLWCGSVHTHRQLCGVALYIHTGDFVVWLCTYTRATLWCGSVHTHGRLCGVALSIHTGDFVVWLSQDTEASTRFIVADTKSLICSRPKDCEFDLDSQLLLGERDSLAHPQHPSSTKLSIYTKFRGLYIALD